MDIKKKFKDMWRKVKGEKTAKKTAPRRAAVDAEISVEEVTREEIFPSGKQKTTNRSAAAKPAPKRAAAKSATTASATTAKKPLSKRTRPTNPDYKMIDPTGNSCDTSKS